LKNQKQPEVFNWKKWRWEFMRRDPEVQNVYQDILKLREEGKKATPDNCPHPEIRGAYKNILDLKKQGKEVPPQVCDEFPSQRPGWCCPYSFDEEGNPNCICYCCTEQGKKEATYCARYGLNSILFLNINKKFEELPGGVFASLFLVKSPVNILGDVDKKILLEIDFNYVNSVKKLKTVVSEEIEKYAGIFRLSDKTKKRTSKNYELIQKAGDMKSEDFSWTREALATELFPDKENKISSAITTIGNALKDYEDLTKKGGWKKLLPI